jgi:thiol-disulfide isomerase/thioredoxin
MVRMVLIAMAVLMAVAGMIVMIGRQDASAADACAAPAAVFKRFERQARGEPAPAGPFFENGETERTFADFRGKALVVNFWATWCPPCVKEMPALDRLRAAVAAEGIEVLAVSNDRGGASVVRSFYQRNQINALAVLIDQASALSRALNVLGLPTTVLFDTDGREVGRVLGTAEWDSEPTVAFLRSCLKPKS